MPAISNLDLLEPLLDSWDLNNRILVNLLHALPQGSMDFRAMDSSPSIAQMFMHIHYVRLVFVEEDAPEHAKPVPAQEWLAARDPTRITQMLNESAAVVRAAVQGRLQEGRQMDRHYGHPIRMLQHMIWHEGYHHGQIKLALKVGGDPLNDEQIGPGTWDIWMDK